jgi:tRNA A37 threonylcarbamoyladenosine biosynthesis protein TsaE
MKRHTRRALERSQEWMRRVRSGEYVNLAGFLGSQGDLKLMYGDVMLLVGPSGANKTTFMQNLVNYSRLPTLYISPEVYAPLFYRRQLQIITGMNKYEVLANLDELFEVYHEELDKIYLIERGINYDTLVSELVTISSEIQPKIIILDHMKLMSVGGDVRNGLETLARQLKEFATENDIIVCMVSQVPKSAMMSVPGKGPRRLEIYDAAEASGLYQICDIGVVINIASKYSPIRDISVDKARDADASMFQRILLKVESSMVLSHHNTYIHNHEPTSSDTTSRIESINSRLGYGTVSQHLRNSLGPTADRDGVSAEP